MKEKNDVRRILNKIMDFIENKNGKDELIKLSNSIFTVKCLSHNLKFSMTNDFKTKFTEDTKPKKQKVK